MVPADLFQWLSLAQKTGTLLVTHDGVEKKIYFERGRILSSASNDPREYLGQFLISHGYISESELKKAMEVQSQSRILLGKILVTIGAISEADLLRLMRLKVEEEIYDVFLWNGGEFTFHDDELPKMELVPMRTDVTGIILEGTRRVDEWIRIRELIPTTDLIPALEGQPDDDSLTEDRQRVIHLIDGRRSIADIILESRSSHFIVAQTLSQLAREGMVRFVEEQEPLPVTVEEPLIPVVVSDLGQDDEIVSLLGRAQGALRTGDYDKALRMLRAAQNLDPDNQTVKNASRGAETFISAALKRGGLLESAVPKLARTFEEISGMNFSPNEGFILSRVNGSWDLGSIIKVSPMREIDALLIFHKLRDQGVITLG